MVKIYCLYLIAELKRRDFIDSVFSIQCLGEKVEITINQWFFLPFIDLDL
jgi:hypothetical protein